MYKCLFKSLFSALLGAHPEVQCLGQIIILCLTFEGTARLFSTAAPFYIPTSVALLVPISPGGRVVVYARRKPSFT